MTDQNFFIQYHNADKLGYFPTEGTDFNSLISDIELDDTEKEEHEWIYTSKKTVKKSIGGICFLIVGKTENRIKNYYLWCYFKIENYIETRYEIIAVGTGKDFKYPIFLNNLPDFDSFKKFCGNFGIGFQNIDNHKFSQTLKSYINEIKENDENFNEHQALKQEVLQKLNDKMLSIKPERKTQEMERLIRNDSEIVRLIKELAAYKCQFPDCNSVIPTEKGINYVEVAHITPVSKGGQSVIGNLIVFCPNHHKEFDLGERNILEENTETISGILNGKHFTIKLSFSYSIQ
jgi:hypothetical protein